MYDAIVVGARCAGSPTAMLLARKGYRVLLVDKATFPSNTMSTHFIHQPGIAALQRHGLLEQVIATNCPPIIKWSVELGSFALTGSAPPADGIAEAYCPRRTVLDKILVEAAVAAGAELREGFTVQQVLIDGDRVQGIRGQAAGGSAVTEQARIVIGADGMRSLVARAVQAPTYNVKPALTCAYYSYWSGVPLGGAEVYLHPGRAVLTFPTNDKRVAVFVEWPNEEFHAFRADIEGNFLKTVDLLPSLAARLRAGRREERFVGTADLPNFFRKSSGPGWALVGDAGYHKDPIIGHGITDALQDAELLAEAVDAGLSGRQLLDEALAHYEWQRNAASMPLYELTCLLASLEPPPAEMQEIFAALKGNQEQINRFLGIFAGTTSIPEFFAPENVQRIMAAATAPIRQ